MSSNMCLSLTANSSINIDNCNSLQHLLIAQQQHQPNLLQEVIMKAIFTTKYLEKN